MRTVHRLYGLAGAVLLMGLVGCSTSPTKAPVSDRTPKPVASTSTPTNTPPSMPEAKPSDPAVVVSTPKPPPPGSENAGKPGYHTVQPGETLTRIMLAYNQPKAKLIQWNQLTNPDLLEVGQVLRVVPPDGTLILTAPPSTSTSPPVARPLPPLVTHTPTPPSTSTSTPPPTPTVVTPTPDLRLIWPANGAVLTKFDEKNNQRGIAIDGKLGDPVLAAADGVVAIAGSPIRGMGNLIIVQHSNGIITAYAHNQTLLVKEDQAVKQGQKIATMGASEANNVKLHFEIRRNGKPVDPLQWLPKR